MTKAIRVKYSDNSLLFTFNDLSQIISSKDTEAARELLGKKFRRGHPLLRRQGLRLIRHIRPYFHFAPQEFHDLIYEIRSHITKRQWYWNKYDPHFTDLFVPQIKALLDVTMGLNLFKEGFLLDAHEILSRNGYIIKGKYRVPILRHHVHIDAGYLLLEINDSGVLKFNLVPLDEFSHSEIHNSSKNLMSSFIAKLINTRINFLYAIVKNRKSVSLSEFRSKKAIINIEGNDISIWEEYSDLTLNKWIERYNNINRLYIDYYFTFFNEIYIPNMNDLGLYKNRDENCKHPEFWYWYTVKYLGEEPFSLL